MYPALVYTRAPYRSDPDRALNHTAEPAGFQALQAWRTREPPHARRSLQWVSWTQSPLQRPAGTARTQVAI